MNYKLHSLLIGISLMTLIYCGCKAESVPPVAQNYFQYYDNLDKDPSLKDHLIIHMMFFPWDKNQRFLDDDLNFDHAPYLKMVERVKSIPNAHVIMWTYSKTKEFCKKNYPAFWNILEKYSQRNIMYIDILRFFIVYHYGGIYWQYDSIPLSSSMIDYLPSKNKKWRLFTESVITQEYALKMANEPIRKGKSEELIRVVTGAFACNERKNPNVLDLIFFYFKRMLTEKLHSDYDVLYISGNAAMSEYYDQYLKNNQEVELTSLEDAKKMINWNSKGSWKMDHLKVSTK